MVASIDDWGPTEREKERKNGKNRRKGLVFGQLWTHISSCQTINPPLFIRDKKGNIVFTREKFQPLVQSRHHELSNLTIQGFLSWQLYADVVATMMSISVNELYLVVEKCHVIILVQVLSNLVEI